MAKISPKFVTYFLFALLALAFLFPITHGACEGMASKVNESESDEEDEENTKEGVVIL
jgi:hypothetical protein